MPIVLSKMMWIFLTFFVAIIAIVVILLVALQFHKTVPAKSLTDIMTDVNNAWIIRHSTWLFLIAVALRAPYD